MCSVSQSLIPPDDGEIAVCERNGHIIYVTDQSIIDSYMEGQVSTFPYIIISSESLRRTPAIVGETAKSAFLEQKETTAQRFKTAWYNLGVAGVLGEICSEESNQIVYPLVQNICQYLLIGMRWIRGMNFTLFPHLKLSQEALIAEFSMNREWSTSPIRFLSWHPKAHKLAIALLDDTIKIHYTNIPLVPILKHKLQKYVTCVEWKPLSASILAVGSQTAILIWTVEPSSFSTRPSAGAVQVLSYSGHSPVTSLAWSPTGDDVLVAVSALNTAIVVWNTSMAEYQVIQHVTTCGGVSRVLWSPDGSKVLAATPSSSFRIFETGLWTNERWSNLAGRVQCACWNPKGTTLLFALTGDSHIYCVKFSNSQSIDSPSASAHATVVLDLKYFDESADSDSERQSQELTKANCIHSMVWDETGQRVAIMFHKDDPRQHLIALFSTSEDPSFSITAKGFLQGKEGVSPVFIAFKLNFDMGACLTVCWSNGSVSYIPMYIPDVNSITSDFRFKAPNPYGANSSMLGSTNPDRSGLWSSMAEGSVFASRTTLN
ncbi:aladin-like [Styela clava]